MQIKKQLLESDIEQLLKLRKEYNKAVYCDCLFNLSPECIMGNAMLDASQAGIKISGRNINIREARDSTLMAESKEELKCLDEKGKWKTWLETQY